MIPTFEEVMKLTGTISNIHVLQVAECEALYNALCLLPGGSTVVEVGCDRGRSSSIIFQLASAKNFLTIHIDPWRWHGDVYDQEQAEKAKQWMEMMCEKCTWHPFILLRMTTIQAEIHLWNLGLIVDLAFIDGSHDEDVVKEDLRIVARRVKAGGFLAAHDYPSGGVTEAIDPFVASGWNKHSQTMGLGIWRRL